MVTLFTNAGVAELVDALDLGSSDRKIMGVQVPSPAPSEVKLGFTFLNGRGIDANNGK